MPPRKAKNLPKLFCPECGSPNSEVASFCTNCGKDLRKLDKKISDIDLLTNHFSEFDIKIDSKINDYKNGSHYLAIKEKTGEKVVIKFLNENAAKNKDHKNLFKNWAVVGSIFNHPNILNVEINGEINERDYMVSAYAESGPLDLILSSYGSSGLPIPLALTIMIKVLKGLEEIHNRGYAIRDLKTGNILIHKSGDPMISGFHLARPFGKMGADSEAENSLMGSVAYMSPERCRLTRSVDKRTDIYSAGIIFYELITGELPFQGETHKVLFQQTSRPLPQVTYRLIAKGLNSIDKKEEKVYQYVNEILRILEKACAKPKSGRYPTASEFSADLEKFLNFISIPLEPKKTRDDQWKVLKGYKADQSGGAGEDRLGITGSVEAFARLVSSKSVHPPLSIGLFGNWGAGKSFFINKLREEIDRLAINSKKAIEEGASQKDLPFYSKIVQIEFNAWHFVDANLWPSLVHHIFSNLKIPGESKEGIKERRNFLIQQIDEEQEGLNELEIEEEEYLKKAEKLEEEIQKESEDYKKIIGGIFRKKIGEELESRFDDALLENWARKAGIDLKNDEKASEKIHKLYEESKKWKDPEFKEVLKKRFKAYSWFVLFAGIVFISLLLISFFVYLYQNTFVGDWVRKEFENATGIAKVALGFISTFATGFYAIGKSVVSFSKKYLNWVPGFFDKLKEAAPDIHTELEKAENEKLQKIEELEKSKESYLTKKDEINSKIQSLEQELSETTEGDLLKSFVQSRMGTDEYSKHLGIQAKIRDDFEKLSNLITEYNKSLEEESYETKDSEHLFNRIILYIDDLDRCPPEKVVEVLQAVHLLLSFPAFIVMVAVDSRWVSQSLRIGYKELFGDQLNIDSDGDGIPDYFRATPHDYLEKIFQIPFWLYPMNMEGRRSLITKLMESSMSSEEESPPAEEEHIEKAEIIGSYKNQGRNIFENEELLSEEHVKEIVQNEFSEEDFDYVAVTESVNLTAQLVIQKIELDFSIILSPILGQSPRALKRFVNVYLLVKVGLSELQWQIYFDKIHPKNGLKDEKNILRNFQSVMFLLAVITGMPSTSRIFFKSLRSKTNNTIYELLDSINVKRKPDGTWTIFGETMDSITSTKKASEQKQIDDEENNEIHNLNMQIEIMQFLKWLEFNRPKKDWGIVDIDQLRYWDPIVSKYSFRVEPFEQD